MDVAALSLNVDSTPVLKAANDLDKFTAAATRAGAATGNPNGSIAKMVALVQSLDTKLSVVISTLGKISTSMDGMASAAQRAAASQQSVTTEATQSARALGAADSHVTTYRQHLEGLAAELTSTKAAMAAMRGQSGSPLGGGTATATAELQRYLAAARAMGPANDNAAATSRLLSATQNKLGLDVRTTTADIRAQIDALRLLTGAGPVGASGGAAAGGATATLALAFGALEAAATAAAAALRAINPPSGGAGGGGGSGGGAGSSSPYYGGANFDATGQSAELAAHHAQNLFYNLNDVFVSLASGQRPMMVFIQQGSQIAQIYAAAGMSLKGFGLGLLGMLGILKTTTAATQAAALAQAQQATASVTAANAQATANVRAAETNILIARTQISMATTATELAAANARLAAATAALAPAQAEAAITSRALATAHQQQATAATAAAAATTTALAPLGIILAAIAAALAIVAAGIAALTRQANDDSGLKKYTTAMGYTREEVEKLNAVSVGWGDTAKAIFQVGWQRIAAAMGITTEELGRKWNSILDWMAKATRATIAGIYAAFTGMQNIIPRIIENIRSGKKENIFEVIGGSFADQYREAQSFMDDVITQAGSNARARQDAMAASMHNATRAKSGGKSNAERLAEIIREAQAEIAAEERRLQAVNMSARAVTELEQRTKLLDQIQKAGIPVTAALRTEVDRLAKAYADAKIAADVAEAIRGVNENFERQARAINDEAALIGLYGDAYDRARLQIEAMNAARDALPRGEVLSDTDASSVMATANKAADDLALKNRLARIEELRKASEDATFAMQLEAGAIGLSGSALEAYNFAAEEKLRYQRAGIQLSAEEIAIIDEAAAAYGRQRYAIDQQIQALADAREISKGFFTDWLDGVRDGGNLFKTFADSVVNSLNKIIDKLIEAAFEQMFFNSIAGASGGGGGPASGIMSLVGSLFANGGAFDQAQKFATGGSFTNTVVNTPTLFRFAKGTKLGEMGEAGPEAIMPLSRGPDGKLGVQARGGQGRGPISLTNEITNNYKVEGGFMPEAVLALIERGGEMTEAQIRRNLKSMLQQLDIDGVMV